MVIDDLAIAIRKKFEETHEAMVSKESFAVLQKGVSILHRDVTEGRQEIAAYLKDIQEEIKK